MHLHNNKTMPISFASGTCKVWIQTKFQKFLKQFFETVLNKTTNGRNLKSVIGYKS